MWDKVFSRLPSNYSEEGQINNKKLHKVIYGEIEEVKKAFEDIRASQDIDNAIGKTLDLIGSNVLEYRETDNDDLFRDFIKLKIISNLSQGDIETINKVASFLLKDKYIETEETWKNALYNDLAGIVIKMYPNYPYIPLALNRVKAGGVRLFFETIMPSDILGLVTGQKDILFDFPLTNEFTTESKKAKVLKEPIYLHTKAKVTPFEYPLCNEFSPQGKSDVTTGLTEIKTDINLTDVIYPLCGEFLVGEVIE